MEVTFFSGLFQKREAGASWVSLMKSLLFQLVHPGRQPLADVVPATTPNSRSKMGGMAKSKAMMSFLGRLTRYPVMVDTHLAGKWKQQNRTAIFAAV